MPAQRIAGGLWVWQAPHPEWRPGRPGSVDDWPREVGSVLFETDGVALFIDPQLPVQLDRFWQWADARCAGRDVIVLSTIAFHTRSRDEIVERYGAASVGAGATSEHEPVLPAGVECLRIPGVEETLVWLAPHQALVVGDTLVGDAGGLRLCPESWLDFAPEAITLDGLRVALSEILDGLPVERVLVSHGTSVLSGGRAALEQALATPAVRRRVRS